MATGVYSDRSVDEPLLKFLADNRVLSVDANDDGTFEVTEACDSHFSATLSADELRTLGEELIALASRGTPRGTE